MRYAYADGFTPGGIYFTQISPEPDSTQDVWAADLAGYEIHPDPFCGEDAALGNCVYVTRDVPAERLYLLPKASEARGQRGAGFGAAGGVVATGAGSSAVVGTSNCSRSLR